MPLDVYTAHSFAVDAQTVTEGEGATQPQVSAAASLDTNTVEVTFDTDMDDAGLLDPDNYSIEKVLDSSPLHVIRVVRSDTDKVQITTVDQEGGDTYEVTVVGVQDTFGTSIDLANNTAQFGGTAPGFPATTTTHMFVGLETGMQAEQGSTPTPDVIAPTVTNQTPAPAATQVARDTNIQFDLTDADSPINLSLTMIYVNAVLAYDGSTDTFQPGFDGAGSLRTPISGGHQFVIDPTSDFASFLSVAVRVVSQDMAIPTPNQLDTTYSFTIEDYESPIIDSFNPPNGTVDVSQTTLYSFSTKDVGGSGVDSSTLNATVDGDNAIINGVFQAPYDGGSSQIVVNAFNGFDVTIDRTSNYPSFKAINVSVSVDDNEGNAANSNTVFTTEDYLGPFIAPVDPLAGATGVDEDTNVVVDITDEQMVSNGFTIEIDRGEGGGFELAFEHLGAPDFKTGYNGAGSQISVITGGYRVTIDPTTDFQFGTTVQIRTTATDPVGNPDRLS